MKVNKIKSMIVNNYNDLSEALKKMFVDFYLDGHSESKIDYFNKTINYDKIISYASKEQIDFFISNYGFFFNENSINDVSNFFQKVRSGNFIKCKFPSIVCDGGIIELDEVKKIEDYKMYIEEDFFEKNLSLDFISKKLKNKVYIYLGTRSECFIPIKKTKEELISFVKNKRFYFPKNINETLKKHGNKTIFFCKNNNGDVIYLTNSAINKKIESFSKIF